MPRRLVLMLLCLALAACAPRGTITLDPDAAGVGAVRQVYFATTRAPDPTGKNFGPNRSSRLRYGRLAVSVPPDRKPGTITWPDEGRQPDPRRDFVTLDAEDYHDDSGFRHGLSQALRQTPAGRGEVVVYIHGYNTSFAESAYRFAQLGHDLDAPAVGVVYAWPSAAKALRYAYDRDSVLFARDGLETLLEEITRAGAARIILVAHSLGTELTMEVLRQMALDHNRAVMARIHGVILMSPDIDTQLFRRQAKVIGRLPQPFVIFTSGRDRSLALSAALTGRSDRLGNLQDLDKVAVLDVTVVDVSAFSTGNGHFNAGNSPTLLGLLADHFGVVQAFTRQGEGSRPLLPGITQTVQRATRIIVEPLAGQSH